MDIHIRKLPGSANIEQEFYLVSDVKEIEVERDAAQIQNKFLAQEILTVREENRLLKQEFTKRGAVWQDFVDRGQTR